MVVTVRTGPLGEIDWAVPVDRNRQWPASAHASQSADNPVPHRRLPLLGDTEHLATPSTWRH